MLPISAGRLIWQNLPRAARLPSPPAPDKDSYQWIFYDDESL
jgi:hypothetical protein